MPTDDTHSRYACPNCHTANLLADLEGDTGVPTCRACGHKVHDLLSLVPVEPVGLLELTLGSGAWAYVRAAAFVAVVLLLLALAVLGR